MEGEKLYEVILIAVIFCGIIVAVLFAVLFIAVNMREGAIKRDKEKNKRLDSLEEKINETQTLFKNEVKTILDNFKKLFK